MGLKWDLLPLMPIFTLPAKKKTQREEQILVTSDHHHHMDRREEQSSVSTDQITHGCGWKFTSEKDPRERKRELSSAEEEKEGDRGRKNC